MNFTGLMDMFDGGGAGRAGQTFEGGPFSGLLNQIGARPAGFQERMGEVRPQMRPQMPAMQQPMQQPMQYGPQSRPNNAPQQPMQYGPQSRPNNAPQQPMQYGPQNGRGSVGPQPQMQQGPQSRPNNGQQQPMTFDQFVTSLGAAGQFLSQDRLMQAYKQYLTGNY